MGNAQSIRKINFEDMQYIIKNPNAYILINTLPENQQQCLIPTSLPIHQEEERINYYLQNHKNGIRIVIYGKNSNDETIYKKYTQLSKLGFVNVYVYLGGLFEWLMLQDIYGTEEFSTTSRELDILKYKPTKILQVPMLEY
jgi:hypothetical protein